MDVAQQRVINQRITGSKFKSPSEVVSWMGAMQAQDYAGALWSIGLRIPGSTIVDIEKAIETGEIVRSWPMRGTLHFMAAEDVRWMMEHIAPRILAAAKGRHENLSLDHEIIERCKDLLVPKLEGKKVLARKEALGILEKAGIATKGGRGYHILWWLSLENVLCFGPMSGKEQTFVLLDEWVSTAKKLDRQEALGKLAEKYFRSHGPATFQDFTGWAFITSADGKMAIEKIKSKLTEEEINGKKYLSFKSTESADGRGGYLLPGFDEFMLGYKDRSPSLDPKFSDLICPGRNGVFRPTIVIDGQVVGTWQKNIKKDKVEIALNPFTKLTKKDVVALTPAAENYAKFLGLNFVIKNA